MKYTAFGTPIATSKLPAMKIEILSGPFDPKKPVIIVDNKTGRQRLVPTGLVRCCWKSWDRVGFDLWHPPGEIGFACEGFGFQGVGHGNGQHAVNYVERT